MAHRPYTPGRGRPPRQVDRVAKVGLAAGRRGTHQGEWLVPGGADGRGRVTRLASRIAELRAEGWRITTAAGKRDGFRVYVFETPPAAAAPLASDSRGTPLAAPDEEARIDRLVERWERER